MAGQHRWLPGGLGRRVSLGGAAFVLAMRIPKLPGHPAGAARAPLLPPRLIGPGLAFLAGVAGSAGFLAFAALYAPDVGLAGAGPVLFVYGAVVIICRVLLARLVDRISAVRLSVAALVICSAGLALMALLRNAAGLIVGTVVLAVGVAFLTPAFYRVLMSRLPAAQRAAAAATFSVFVDLGLGGGPILFGLIAKKRTSRPPSASADLRAAGGNTHFLASATDMDRSS